VKVLAKLQVMRRRPRGRCVGDLPAKNRDAGNKGELREEGSFDEP
jgi:hypothetical protein